MKVLKSLFLCVGTVLLALNFTACTDWGDADPAAGNQTYPDRSVVNTYTFDYGADDVFMGDIASKTDVCEAVEDADLGSNVLHLDASGHAVMANPFNGVKLQNGAAITFWLKTAGIPQEAAEGEEEAVVEDDLTGAVIAFGSDEPGAERFYLTSNGQLRYTKPGNLESLNLNENDPATYKTGILPAGGWHFVALQITEDGYQLYVDGNKSLSGATPLGQEATTFSYKTLIEFLNTAPNIYIGKGAGDNDVNMSEMWVDDVKLIRNQMIASDWAKPNKGGGASDDFEYIIGEPDNEIGTPDCATAWWTDWGNYFRIPANTTLHLQFVNHTSGAGNWNNWNIAITTDADRGAAGYAEYLVLRSDLYGWGDSYTSGTWTSVGYPTNDTEWATYRQDMEGATVDIDIARAGNQVTMTAVAHCTNGKVYQESFTAPCGEESDVIRTFLAVDASYLVMNWDNCYVRQDVDVTTTEVGAADNSTAFWGAFTDYFTIPADKALVLNFTNYSGAANAWNNWVAVVCTDAERAGAGYAEYFVLRADNYGWGDATYNAANIGLVGYDGDWVPTFSQQMNGAQVEMTIGRVGAEVNFTASATCTDGHVFTETYHQTCGDGTQVIRAFLTVDGSHLIMDPANCYLKVPLVK